MSNNPYTPAIDQFLAQADGDLLNGGRANPKLAEEIQRRPMEELFSPHEITDPTAAKCCLAGILLRLHCLDASHDISQQIDTAEGSYWHAIMHRREGDFSNSKYWCRRAGRHPIDKLMADEVRRVAQVEESPPSEWSPSLEREGWTKEWLVDACQQASPGKTPGVSLIRELADAEWNALFDFCFRQAID